MPTIRSGEPRGPLAGCHLGIKADLNEPHIPLHKCEFALTISDLTPKTTWHYRLVASNSYGKTTGLDEKFTTPDVGADVAEAAAARVRPAERRAHVTDE